MIAADVLLTGTAGVGRDVLFALLRRTPVRVALLMADDTLQLEAKEQARIDLLGGDIAAPDLALQADVRGRLTETIETIVHPSGVTGDVLLLAERCFMAGRLQRFIHVDGASEDRMVRAAKNAGLPVTIIGPRNNTTDHVVSAVVRAVSSDARCAQADRVRYVLIDRITALEPGRTLTAIKNVSLSDDLVARVRPGVSALPASMVLEAMAQAAGLLVVASVDAPAQPVLAKVQPFTAYGEAAAGDQIRLRAELEDVRSEGARARVVASVGDTTIADAVIYLGLMPVEGDERIALMRERLADAFPGWFDVTTAVGPSR